jgi:hypothetical protein
MERMMDGGSGGYGSDPMSSGSEMGTPGEERPARKPAARKKSSGAGGRKRARKKVSKARAGRGRAKSKAGGKARGRTRARAKKASKKARRR